MSHNRIATALVVSGLAVFCAAVQSAPSSSASAEPSGSAATDMKGLSKADTKKYAASHFMGFYAVNGSTAADVCRAEGVDLTEYLRAFHLKHAAELAQASKVMKAEGISTGQMATVAEAQRNEMEATVRRTMLELAVALHETTIADGCSFVAAHVVDAVSAQSFAEQNPQVWAVLMSD
jgi:hypothetical protein